MPFGHFLIESHPDRQQYQQLGNSESDCSSMYLDCRNAFVSRVSSKRWQYASVLTFQIILAGSVIGVPLIVFPLTGYFSLRKLRHDILWITSTGSFTLIRRMETLLSIRCIVYFRIVRYFWSHHCGIHWLLSLSLRWDILMRTLTLHVWGNVDVRYEWSDPWIGCSTLGGENRDEALQAIRICFL